MDHAEMRTVPPEAPSIAITELANAHLVAVRGDLDSSLADPLVYVVGQLSSHDVIVNLGGLRFVDPVGIEALCRAKRVVESRGHQLLVINARGGVRRAFEEEGESELLVC